MKDDEKTKEQLIRELNQARQAIHDLQASEPKWKSAVNLLKEIKGQLLPGEVLQETRYWVWPPRIDRIILWGSIFDSYAQYSGKKKLRLVEWSELIHPDDYQSVMRQFDAIKQGDYGVFQIDARIITESGDWRDGLIFIVDYGLNESDDPGMIRGYLMYWTRRSRKKESSDQDNVSSSENSYYSELMNEIQDMLSWQGRVIPHSLMGIEKLIDIGSIPIIFNLFFGSRIDFFFVKERSKYTLVNQAMCEFLGCDASDVWGYTEEDIFQRGVHATYTPAESYEAATYFLGVNYVSRTFEGKQLDFLEITMRLGKDGQQEVCIAINLTARQELEAESSPEEVGVLGYRSKAMKQLEEAILRSAETDCTVLLLGETGSGKSLWARQIHERSRRTDRPFTVVDCTAIPGELAESELFGHEKGAFTGSVGPRKGRLRQAEGGTLFLDEIGELSSALQAKLLRFLEHKTFTPVGGEKEVTVDARIIAATNRDLEQEVEKGNFRSDLYHRLNVFSIEVPPLRDRYDDIPILVKQMVTHIKEEQRLSNDPFIDPSILKKFTSYDWPGNVRELQNVLKAALARTGGTRVDLLQVLHGLSPKKYTGTEKTDETSRELNLVDQWAGLKEFPKDKSYNELVDDLKRSLIEEALREADGVKAEAARQLGMSRSALIRQIKTLRVD